MSPPVPNRIYLDNAATSFPKPEASYGAIEKYNRQLGVAVGRSAYQGALEVQNVIDRCRKRASDFFSAENPDHVIFTFNGTDSLNLAIHGLLNQGDHVVTTVLEHNSVLRPLRELRQRLGIHVTSVKADRTGLIDAGDVQEAITAETKLVAVIHASNVTGTIQPIADIGEICRKKGVLFLVDAAQSAGHLPIDVNAMAIDLLACPGHKGLLGPLGTGLLYVRPGVEERLKSFRQGGTGSKSEDDRQPETLPDKYESGNHNAPGLFGLEASLAYLQERGIPSLRKHEQSLTDQLLDAIQPINGVTSHGSPNSENRVGVVSLSVEGFEPQILSTILDENFGIQTRAGLHCAPGVHKCLGTFESGGTLRLSFGPFSTEADVDAVITAFREIAGN